MQGFTASNHRITFFHLRVVDGENPSDDDVALYRYVFYECEFKRQTCLVTLVGSCRKFELMSPDALTDEGVFCCMYRVFCCEQYYG